MKSLVLFFLLFSLFASNTAFCKSQKNDEKAVSGYSINIVSSQELYPITTAWKLGYEKNNSQTSINIEKLNAGTVALTKDYLYFTPENPDLTYKAHWKMIIGREAVVPIVNSENPLLNTILPNGITSRSLQQLLTATEQNWGTLTGTNDKSPVRFYIDNDDYLINKVADFAGTAPKVIRDKMPVGSDRIVSFVQKDINAIGFCKLTDILDAANNRFIEGIRILPVDKNSNGRIDPFENIYGSPEAFTRGVWIGKYPAKLSSNLYAVSASKPTGKATLDFLTWIQTDGQPLLSQSGFSTLAINERRSNIESLNIPVITAEPGGKRTLPVLWTIIVAFLLITPLIWYHSKARSKKIPLISGNVPEIIRAMPENSIKIPKGLYFDKSHTWVFMEKEGTVRVGIDDFLQHTTGELTSVTMKEPGELVRKGEKILTVSHNGKKLDIHAPISGIIKERNRSLLFDSTLLNNAPFTDGWVYAIEPKNWLKENRFLFMSEKYTEWIGDEITRLKDFIAMEFKSGDLELSPVILQDGGEICDNVLANLDPKVWENFQTRFLDTSR